MEINGGFRHNPARKRARKNELTSPRGIGEPPKHFMIQEPDSGWIRAGKLREMWEETKLEDPDIPRCCRGTVESLCYIKVEMRALPTGSKRWAQLANTEDKLRSSLALTRVTRPKVNGNPNAGTEAPEDGLAGLAQEGRTNRRA
jgi:hypothetical protein